MKLAWSTRKRRSRDHLRDCKSSYHYTKGQESSHLPGLIEVELRRVVQESGREELPRNIIDANEELKSTPFQGKRRGRGACWDNPLRKTRDT